MQWKLLSTTHTTASLSSCCTPCCTPCCNPCCTPCSDPSHDTCAGSCSSPLPPPNSQSCNTHIPCSRGRTQKKERTCSQRSRVGMLYSALLCSTLLYYALLLCSTTMLYSAQLCIGTGRVEQRHWHSCAATVLLLCCCCAAAAPRGAAMCAVSVECCVSYLRCPQRHVRCDGPAVCRSSSPLSQPFLRIIVGDAHGLDPSPVGPVLPILQRQRQRQRQRQTREKTDTGHAERKAVHAPCAAARLRPLRGCSTHSP
jgi:hypothetical protein